MELVHTIQRVRDRVAVARAAGKSVGFVPTMGALHVGHASLIEAARKACDYVVVSIFVNPTQFGPSEDLDKYPRDLEGDRRLCEQAGADLIFAPSVGEMYPAPNRTWVDVEDLTANLCGRHRPGHFRGVTTVCAKLFNIVQADRAFFGQKDAQQACVIRRMANDLNLPLEIVVCPTVREADGLAVSSRNRYLSPEHRPQASLIWTALEQCRCLIDAGERNADRLTRTMLDVLAQGPDIRPQYVQIVDADTLEDVQDVRGRILIAVAAFLDSTRLIDNLLVDLNPPTKRV